MRNSSGSRVQWLCQLGSVLIVSSLFSACGGRTRGLDDLETGSGSSGQGDGDGDGDGDPGTGGTSTGGRTGHVGTGGVLPSGGTVGAGGGAAAGTGGGFQTGGTSGDACLLPLDAGSCLAAMTRFGFDPATGQCRVFTYGGCGGNANNYNTLEECNAACSDRAQCFLPPEPGDCDGALPRYHYDAASGSCEQFIYGGCGGNANNFESATECYDTCSSGDLEAAQQCNLAADCTLMFKGCCEPCEGKTPADYWAINKDFKDEGPWVKQNCTAVDCAVCQGGAEVGVACENNTCVAFETKRFAACDEDDDCVVRCGAECCNKGPWTAFSDVAGLEQLVCAPEMSCRTCVDPPEAPPAFCDDSICRVKAE